MYFEILMGYSIDVLNMLRVCTSIAQEFNFIYTDIVFMLGK